MSEPEPADEHGPAASAVRSALDSGDLNLATTLALRRFGPELLGFLAARIGIERAQDVFQDFSIKLLGSWPSFRWSCSLRTWLYRMTRSVLIDAVRRADYKRERDFAPLDSAISQAMEHARSVTVDHLRSSVKSKARMLREQLSVDDQELLALRVDKDLSYREIGLVLELCAPEDDAATHKRVEARVRQRFHDARERFAKLAHEAGLAAAESSGDREP